MILLVDNYDSFTYNLVHLFQELGAEVEHDGRGVLQGLPSPLRVARYHSLVADPDLPPELELSASLGDVVMGVRHRKLPAEGVQFHPESVLTEQGKLLLRNFLDGASASR